MVVVERGGRRGAAAFKQACESFCFVSFAKRLVASTCRTSKRYITRKLASRKKSNFFARSFLNDFEIFSLRIVARCALRVARCGVHQVGTFDVRNTKCANFSDNRENVTNLEIDKNKSQKNNEMQENETSVVLQLLDSNNRLHARFKQSETSGREKERHIEK